MIEASEHVRVVVATTLVLDFFTSRVSEGEFFKQRQREFQRTAGVARHTLLESMAVTMCGMFKDASASLWTLIEAIVVCDFVAFDKHAFRQKPHGPKLLDRAKTEVGLVA